MLLNAADVLKLYIKNSNEIRECLMFSLSISIYFFSHAEQEHKHKHKQKQNFFSLNDR
jgi:hypothetical protein